MLCQPLRHAAAPPRPAEVRLLKAVYQYVQKYNVDIHSARRLNENGYDWANCTEQSNSSTQQFSPPVGQLELAVHGGGVRDDISHQVTPDDIYLGTMYSKHACALGKCNEQSISSAQQFSPLLGQLELAVSGGGWS